MKQAFKLTDLNPQEPPDLDASPTEEVGHGSKGMLGRVVGSRSVVTNLRAVRTPRNDKFSLQKGRKSVNSAIYSISFLRLPLAHID